MTKLLFITRHYLSDNNGGANATKGFIHAFSSLSKHMTVIYPEHEGQDSHQYVPEKCQLLPCYDHRSRIRKGLDIYRGRLHRLTDFVHNHLRTNHYTTIVLDHSLTAAGIIRTLAHTKARIITIHHNVERDYLRDNLPPLSYRIPMIYYSRQAERDALLLSDVNLTLTHTDASTFKAWFPDKDLNLHTIGIGEYRGLPSKTFSPPHIPPTRFVISGSLGFKQSLYPILTFLKEYYPILKAEIPTVSLTIAGRGVTSQLIKATQGLDNVYIFPDPQDLSEIVRQSDIYLCPINTGSGIKLRIMDGLKEGMPIISHEVSTRGYEPLVEQGIIHQYNDFESFRIALKQVANTRMEPQQIYNVFQELFSITHLTQEIQKALS